MQRGIVTLIARAHYESRIVCADLIMTGEEAVRQAKRGSKRRSSVSGLTKTLLKVLTPAHLVLPRGPAAARASRVPFWALPVSPAQHQSTAISLADALWHSLWAHTAAAFRLSHRAGTRRVVVCCLCSLRGWYTWPLSSARC